MTKGKDNEDELKKEAAINIFTLGSRERMAKLRENLEEWAMGMKEEIEMAEILADMGIMQTEQHLDKDFNE